MEVVVISDEEGRILSIGRSRPVEDGSSDALVENAIPLPGQQIHRVDLPLELQEKPLSDLHNEFRVAVQGELPGFVRVRDSAEPGSKT